ncbi:hypothetical protein Xen7305DRAFT_00051190 [Xenococcus sp. PCC 7305]|uniref:DUF4079 domain-containing protein n=1 Tax=Xenococcus sp. PCC 7305 TaxID=102125 RepID=UPI0002ACC180|nr:DUF4079 domain-containing protein [Xenococcus sp. PCC 7305]ELS05376.1 hypothetical protein Xen7305DRAFT_00051190 [Xenococcus sp. PCC 7305]
MVENLTESLKPIADWFASFGLPDIVVHWGHPLMMGIVVFVMGSVVGLSGWRSRQLKDTDIEKATTNKAKHRQIAPLMFIFLASGYTGGVLSMVMQEQNILESPHFWTGSIVLSLLTINVVLSAAGFIGNKSVLRTIHAYVGSLALAIMVIHAVLGVKLGLSI